MPLCPPGRASCRSLDRRPESRRSLSGKVFNERLSIPFPLRLNPDLCQGAARARRDHVGQTIRIDCPELSRSSASAGTKYVRKAFNVFAFALGANAWIPPFSRQTQCGRKSPISPVHSTEPSQTDTAGPMAEGIPRVSADGTARGWTHYNDSLKRENDRKSENYV